MKFFLLSDQRPVLDSAAQVHGFEPDTIRRLECEQNAVRNDLDVTFHDVALGDGSTFEVPTVKDLTVETVHGDVWRVESGVSPPDIIKIDIEGGEFGALASLESTLSSTNRAYVETHDSYASERDVVTAIATLLSDYGFDVTEIDVDREETFLRGVR